MPKALHYREGSVIYFQGDAADKSFILQNGSVNLTYQNIETGQDEHELLQSGEFFGVRSSLGKYNREETAIALKDSVIMAFSVNEFEQLAMANTRIVMKMLKVFSNQLRRIHRQVTSLMENEEQTDAEAGLYAVGDYYLKNKRYLQAKYVFSRYLTFYPAGVYAIQAAKALEAVEAAAPQQGSGKGTLAPGVAASSAATAGGIPVAPSAEAVSRKAAPSRAGAGVSVPAMTDAAKAYYDAVSFITQEKYQQAYMALRKIIETSLDLEYTAKSSFDVGRCFFLMGKHNDCIEHFTKVLTKYPKHPELSNALFFMGQSYEKLNRKDQAAAFYKKILTIVVDEEEGVHIKAKRALKALEA
jgi:CRP-like cAMP-binding protein